MFRRAACAFPVLLVASACTPTRRPPAPTPGSTAPPPLRPDPPKTLAERLKRESWMTRFWEQLTPSQRRRVLARLRRGDPPLATNEQEAAPVWDALGLPDR